MEDAPELKKITKSETPFYSRIMLYLVSNAFSFTVGVMSLVHTGLVILFLISGVYPLVLYNLFSVIIYILCYFLCKLGRILPVYASVILEVTFYSVISTYYIGLRCGTYFFLFSIIPIIIYFGSTLFKGLQRWSVALMLVLNFVTFSILYFSFSYVTPVYDVSPSFRTILVVFSAFAMVFAILFYNAMYIFSSEHEVNILEQKNKELSADAHNDALTSLLNRRGFLPMAESLMRDEDTSRFCIAFCDLDDFKRVNDTFGHDAGDEVLKHITLMITEEMQGCDICRWGGEEIVILMRGFDLQDARAKTERLRKNIESEPTVFFNKQIPVTVTIGLAENKDTYNEPEEIIRVADARMYYGKRHGKNVVISEDLA